MKAILFENKIITLENFFSAKIYHSGTGAKSNPHQYTITIEYTNSNRANHLDFDEDEKLAEVWLNKIFTTLTEEKKS